MNFWKRLRIERIAPKAAESSDLLKRQNFRDTIDTVQGMLNAASLVAEKAMILDHAIDVIGKDLSCSVAARLLYCGRTPREAEFTIPAPSSGSMEKGNYSISGLNVVIDTYDTEKLRKAIPSVRVLGFRQQMNYSTGIMYPEIGLVVIINGRHHLASAIVQKSGSAKLNVCSLKKAFSTLTTDGAYWYSHNTTPYSVYDYRVAVLYELARIRNDLQVPDKLDGLSDLETPILDGYNRILSYGGTHYYEKILELELKIKNYQLQLLRSEKGSENFVTEIEQLEKVTTDLKQEFRDWVNRSGGR